MEHKTNTTPPVAKPKPIPPKPKLNSLRKSAVKPALTAPSFRSSLVDTVRAVFPLDHCDLAEIAARNPNLNRGKGATFRVINPTHQTSAELTSRCSRTELIIEGSPSKFLTGQNVIGDEEILKQTTTMIFEALRLAGIPLPPAKRLAIKHGDFRLLRVDHAMHCDCGTRDRADVLMKALRRLLVSGTDDVSCYSEETIYVGQHSTRRTLRIYRKDIEVEKRPISVRVYRRAKWVRLIDGVVRFELTLRAEELKRLGLDDPRGWNPKGARDRMRNVVTKYLNVSGAVPNLENRDALSRATQLKLDAWCNGLEDAFSRDSAKTYATNRREVKRATGIDIVKPLSLEMQCEYTIATQQVFREGLGFKQWPNTWNKMLDRART